MNLWQKIHIWLSIFILAIRLYNDSQRLMRLRRKRIYQLQQEIQQ